jgi:hypothetical protein
MVLMRSKELVLKPITLVKYPVVTTYPLIRLPGPNAADPAAPPTHEEMAPNR